MAESDNLPTKAAGVSMFGLW